MVYRRSFAAWRQSWLAIALLVALLGLVSLGVLASVVDRQATASVRSEARTSLSSATTLTARFLGAQLDGVEDLVASYAGRPTLRRALTRPTGEGTGALERQMAELQRTRTDVLTTAAISDADGTLLAAPSNPSSVGSDVSNTDWYDAVTRSGQPYVSDAYTSQVAGDPLLVSIAAPVFDGQEHLLAIITVGYTLADLQAFLTEFSDAVDIDVLVTDQAGVVIVQPGATPTSLSLQADDARVREALAGRTGTSEDLADSPGGGALSAYSPVPSVGWAVVAALPQSRAYAEVNRLQRSVLLIALSLGLVMLLGSGLLAAALRARDLARKQAERLASINAAVLDASREGVTLAGPDGGTLLRNSTMSGLGIGSRGPVRDVYAEMARLGPTMTEPDEFSAVTTALRLDPELVRDHDFTLTSSQRSFHLYSRPVNVGAGPVGRLFVVRETTAEREAAAAVQESRDEAERANGAKSEFLSRMSHELRTPLNAILGFAQLLAMSDLPGAVGDRVEHIDVAGRHLLELINEMLDISRIEAGSLELSPEPVQLSELLAETWPLVGGLAHGSDVTLELVVPGDHWVLADRQRLKQVVVNLLTNAIKYNRVGGSVSVGSTLVGSRLQLRVSDTGGGIPEERRDDLFVPFNRLGADTSGVEGSGLGLSLSRALAEALGGRLVLDASSPKGSTFLLELPATSPWAVGSSPPGPIPGSPPDPLAAAEPDRTGRRHTVLYVEDNAANVALMTSILRSRPNLTLVTSGDGARGLELANSERPSLILLDLHLPGLSGEEVLVALKAEPRTVAIPVVIVTADVLATDPDRLLALGAAEFITKPLDVVHLLALVDATLDPSPAADVLSE